jgi:exopolyphosphatase/guanosine-5'-triphosphate,3'-diphosphate pyrophosphatase
MRVAAIDLGSNSFHLLVADVHVDGHIDPLVQEKEMLRLGDVVSRRGAIPPTAADQAVATVRRFRLLAEATGASEIIANATSAIRRAANGGEVVDRIRAETGVHVDVIGGLEEARLIFGAIRASVVLDPSPALCFDLGGGSLEIMVGDAGAMTWASSVPLGVARMSADFVHSDPISKRDRRALRDHINTTLAPVVTEVAPYEPKLAIGSSGTLESLAEMVAARRDEDAPTTLNQLTIDRREFLALHDDLMASTAADRLRIDGLDARRVDLIVAGSMVLATAMDVFGFDGLTISEWALREGIVLDAVRFHDPTEWSDDPHAIRGSAVAALARRCNWSEPHARQVAKLSLEVFDATAASLGLDASDRELLEFAALLHDIGEHVASSGHHKHGAYLVQNGQLRGFAPDEVQLLAAVVRWHRRGEPRVSDEFPLLDSAAIERVRALAAILRVADGLDRSRSQNVTGLDVMVTPSLVLLRVSALDDAELEIWGARRKRVLLERVLDRELELTTHPSMG